MLLEECAPGLINVAHPAMVYLNHHGKDQKSVEHVFTFR